MKAYVFADRMADELACGIIAENVSVRLMPLASAMSPNVPLGISVVIFATKPGQLNTYRLIMRTVDILCGGGVWGEIPEGIISSKQAWSIVEILCRLKNENYVSTDKPFTISEEDKIVELVC